VPAEPKKVNGTLTSWIQVALAIIGMGSVAIVTVTRIESTTNALAIQMSFQGRAVEKLASSVDKLSDRIDGQTVSITNIDRRVTRLEEKHVNN